MLWEHGSRNPTREHREHRGDLGPVPEHGGQHAGVAGQAGGGLGQVLRPAGYALRPGYSCEFEKVLGEGGVVVGDGGQGHPGQEGQARHYVREGGVDQVSASVNLVLLGVCRGRHFVFITFWFFFYC